MRYRVEQLAAACDVSVDTIRYYQSRGLLPAPEREGRVAYYGEEHVERIRRIRALQGKGLTLAAVARVIEGDLEPVDVELAAAVAAARGELGEPSGDGDVPLTLEEFASRSGVPASLIEAVQREGIRLGVVVDGETRYTAADVETVRAALRLLEFGLPLPDLLALAADANRAMEGLADRAVELFDRAVREPARDTAGTPEEAAARIVEAFDALLPAVTGLVANHFRRVLLAAAEEKLS